MKENRFFEILKSEICTKWEKIKRAQEQRIDEISVQKLTENHETIQQLTSQLHQMQEQMNSMNSSGEFQDIESNKSGRLSHVSSQRVMIPSSRTLLSRDKRLPLDTSNQSGAQDNAFGNQFSTFDSPRDFPQRIQSDVVQRNREAAFKCTVCGSWNISEFFLNYAFISSPSSSQESTSANGEQRCGNSSIRKE